MADERITRSDAQMNATKTLLHFLTPAGEVGQPGGPWSIYSYPPEVAEAGAIGSVLRDTVEIYDIDGELLFYDFVTRLNDDQQLRVRAAADKSLKTPVWSLGINPPFDIQAAVGKALEKAAEHNLEPASEPERLVCYSYPKLGLLCRSARGMKVVIDLGHIEPVSVVEAGPPSSEYLTLWSPFDLVGRASEASFVESWSFSEQTLPVLPSIEAGLEALLSAIEGAREIEMERVLPGMTLRGQKTPFFCAVATAQMILAYHGIVKTQEEIAAAMKTGPAGTNNSNQIQGYHGLAGEQFTAIYDDTASFLEAKEEISLGRPFKSGVPGHARACGGWKTVESPNGTQKRWLYIFDPWPPEEGRAYWESWGAIGHTNYIYLRLTEV